MRQESELIMATLTVALPIAPYDIEIKPGGLGELGQHVKPLILGQKLLIVSHPAIYAAYGETIKTTLTQAGYETYVHLIPAGERFKTLKTWQGIHAQCYHYELDRRCGLIALGGGVVGDMTGFAAATWLRGIPFIQVPTSLLAMVDAAIGGKTGVNTPQGKNLVGAFHQPRLVLIDPQVLTTLPGREWRSGLAEVIKYGVIWDAELFMMLEKVTTLKTFSKIPLELVLSMIFHSCQAKAKIVAQDEKEGGLRAILNYGHTIGHALETATHYRRYTHGEAIGLGMQAAGQLAVNLDFWTQTEQDRQHFLLAKAGLPQTLPDLDLDDLLRLMQGDKKVQDRKLRFVLPTCIGQAKLVDTVISADILKVLGAKV